MRFPGSLAIVALPFMLNGCGPGVAVTLAVLLSDPSGGGSDAPPTVSELSISSPESPDRVLVEFRILNDDAGRLRARIEYQRLQGGPGPRPGREATAVPGFGVPDQVLPGETVRFLWDARQDLGGESEEVLITVVPLEDGVEGEPSPSIRVRAGNTPAAIRGVRLASGADVMVVTFQLTDGESDRVYLRELALGLDPGETKPITFFPVDLQSSFAEVRRDFPSGRSPRWEEVNLNFFLANSPAESTRFPEALQPMVLPGFRGWIQVRVSVYDFDGEEPAVGTVRFLLDRNNPPDVEILPPAPGLLVPRSGVIPIRFRGFDPEFEFSLLAVQVEVDLSDGLGFRPAIEFPAPPSGGLAGLLLLDPGDRGKPETRSQTFLWDAVSQWDGGGSVNLRIVPSDGSEAGPASQLQNLTVFPQPGLVKVADLATGRLPVALASGDFNLDGFDDLAVANQDSDDVTYLRGGPGGLVRVRELEAGDEPAALAGGDFTGDGYPDVAVANHKSDRVTLLTGGGDGLIRAHDIGVGKGPTALASGRFNLDDFLDVAVASRDSNSVTILHGTQNGLIHGQEITVKERPVALAAGDFDADGFQDLAVVSEGSEEGRETVTCLRGGGPEGLERPKVIGVERGARAVAAGNFDGDAYQDLAVVSEGSDIVTCMRGGEGGLEEGRQVRVGDGPVALTLGDFDGDGRQDVAVANAKAGSVTHLRGGPECLSVVREVGTGETPVALAPGDFDGDGFLDVAVANRDSDTVSHLRGGPAGLAASGRIEVGNRPVALAAGDFDGDGRADVAAANVASSNVTLLRTELGGLRRAGEVDAGDGPFALTIGDFDGDGIGDAVVANLRSDSVTLLRGGPAGPRREAEIEIGDEPTGLAAGDFDGDGSLDVAVANHGSNEVAFLRWGPGGASAPIKVEVEEGPIAVASGDFDGDGRQDLAVANQKAPSVSFLRWGPEGPSPVSHVGVGNGPVALASGRFNDDRFQDVAVANLASNTVTYLQGGPEGLERVRELQTGTFPIAVTASDFDGDGFQDAAVANYGSATVTVLSGGPSGLLGPAREVEVKNTPAALTSADFDGDGFPDLAVANGGAASVSFLRGGPDGLARVGELMVGTGPAAPAAGDFDGDGFPDVVVANKSSDSVSLLRGGPGGLSPGGAMAARDAPIALAAGDLDGDGFLDVIVANQDSDNVTYLHQRYLIPHVNIQSERGAGPEDATEPRHPPRYSLTASPGFIRPAAPVCLVLGPLPELPQAEVRRASLGKNFLLAVSYPVSVLRQETEVAGSPDELPRLTLRLRDHPAEVLREAVEHPERIRVYRRDPAAGPGGVAEAGRGEIRLVDFAGGKGVVVPLRRFGTYLAAIETER